MVVIHVKKTDDLQFLYETSVNEQVDAVLGEICEIWNRLILIRRLCDSLVDLAKFGPAKHPEKQGLDEYDESAPPRGPFYCPDPTGRRTGEAPEPKLAEIISRQISDALREGNARDSVTRKENLTCRKLQEIWDSLRGAVMIAFPQGLPEYDEIRIAFDHDEFEADSRVIELIPVAEATLWWAGKQLMRGQKLGDFVGRNEKTKIVAKLTKGGGSAPSREPIVDERTQKEMMAFYFKKQEELKKLEENADDSYLNAAWANPASLKASLQGSGSVSIRPSGGRR